MTTDTAYRPHIIIPVWGPRHTALFLKCGLPSHLAPGNLPAIAHRRPVYWIVTDADDAETIRASDAFERLAKRFDARIVTPETEPLEGGAAGGYSGQDILGYFKMTRFYLAAQHRAVAEDGANAAFFMLTAEGICSDGMFAAFDRRFEEGYRAVVNPGFRLSEEDALEPMLREHLTEDGAFAATPRELVRWLLRAPHPITLAHIWHAASDGDAAGGEPARAEGNHLHPHYYFEVPNQGFVVHAFHTHPLAIWPVSSNPFPPDDQTVDHEYVQNAVPLHKIHYPTDTDELIILDVALGTHLDDHIMQRPYSRRDVVDFALQWTNGTQRRLFERPILAHATDIGPPWEPVRAAAGSVAAEVVSGLERTIKMRCYHPEQAVFTAADADADVRPRRLVRCALDMHRRVDSFRQRREDVGLLRAFAIRTRLRRALGRTG